MLYRKQYVKTLRQSGKRVFDCLVDTEQDLQELTWMGEGSLAYVRAAEAGKRWLKTTQGWEVV